MATLILFSFLALFIAFVFFLFVPGIGAFSVRARWRSFRSQMTEASKCALIDYSRLNKENEGKTFRFFGILEAIQDRNKIWIRSGDLSIAADLEEAPVYILPSISSRGGYELVLSDEEPQRVPWKQISSLPAGVQLFVAGSLFIEDGRAIFRSRSRTPLLCVLYDGSKESLLKRAIWCGRQKNEYWNQYTLISLITGCFSLLFLSYYFLVTAGMRLPALVSLTLSLSPLVVVFPPGVLLFFLYGFFWRRARMLRAERDLQRLPLRYFEIWDGQNTAEAETALPDGQRYAMLRGSSSSLEDRMPTGGASPLQRYHPSVSPVGEELYLFGSPLQRGGRFDRPEDPMAELALVTGDPEENAQRCNRTAKIYTVLSGLFLSLDTVLNLFFLLLLLRLIIP
jgi:hypothetical protein